MVSETIKAGLKSPADDTQALAQNINGPVVMFDGVCNLCDGFVQFILNNEKDQKLMFTSLQSETGQALLTKNGLPADFTESVVVYENGKIHKKSEAVFRVMKHLKSPYSFLNVFKIVPKFARNYVYDFVAKNRYRWFGQKDECMIPSPELRSRFYN